MQLSMRAKRVEKSCYYCPFLLRLTTYASLTSNVLSAPSAPAETSCESPFQAIDETPPRCLFGCSITSAFLPFTHKTREEARLD